MNIRVSCLFVLNLLFAFHTAFGITPEEVKERLKSMGDNDRKVNFMIESSRKLFTTHPTESLQLAGNAIKLAERIQSKEGLILANSHAGMMWMNRAKYPSAIKYLEKAIADDKKHFNKRKGSKVRISENYFRIGISYEKQNLNHKAKTAYEESLKYAREADNVELIARSHNAIGEVEIKLESYQNAYNSFERALSNARNANKKELTLKIEKNLGACLALLQNFHERQAYQSDIAVISDEIQRVRDSLEIQQEETQVLITEKQLLELERLKSQAEIQKQEEEQRSLELGIKNRDMELRNQAEKEQKFLLLAGGVGLILFMFLSWSISSGISRKKQKKKVEGLLHNILPVQIADELQKNEKVAPKLHEEVTILFTDFKGFTRIAAKWDPERLVATLNEVFEAFDTISEKYGLEKIKTIGDAYMAVCGLPSADPNHAINVIAAAMEMQEYMYQWIGRAKRRGEDVWELRVGIHSGSVIAGVIGKKKFAYDIWGDDVNVAARLESAGAPGKINVSIDTFELTKQYCEFSRKRTVEVKNRGEIEMYYVKDVTATYNPKKKTWSPKASEIEAV
ncbi:adenylate/guanylate cyclase domain-containing protein [Pontibacter sp. G13]|uniref:adenylate/guanylate cyclase domain-containing protein n=1 Tax=Pontibacter sp. G13 TaxID=3074898 RepID=UPI002889A651|nr:adenylate/guanylate cyclase domain-containing protein [Pontibacter sp. G13]WNJ21340.1 adenylate/guanylate cyclase domain-containing protein [Pontibacter sp. G13]